MKIDYHECHNSLEETQNLLSGSVRCVSDETSDVHTRSVSIELPKDAKDREIPLDTKVLYDRYGDARKVRAFEYSVVDSTWKVSFLDRWAFRRTTNFYLSSPESWESLLEDLDKGAATVEVGADLYCCEYFGAYDCEVCPARELSSRCGSAVLKNVADRIRALRGESE